MPCSLIDVCRRFGGTCSQSSGTRVSHLLTSLTTHHLFVTYIHHFLHLHSHNAALSSFFTLLFFLHRLVSILLCLQLLLVVLYFLSWTVLLNRATVFYSILTDLPMPRIGWSLGTSTSSISLMWQRRSWQGPQSPSLFPTFLLVRSALFSRPACSLYPSTFSHTQLMFLTWRLRQRVRKSVDIYQTIWRHISPWYHCHENIESRRVGTDLHYTARCHYEPDRAVGQWTWPIYFDIHTF
jgi:hypothetical protein